MRECANEEMRNGLEKQKLPEAVSHPRISAFPQSRTKFASVAPMPSIVDFAFQRSLPL